MAEEIKKEKLADVVKKEPFNIPISTSFSAPSGQSNYNYSIPSNLSPSSIMYWPAPNLWYQQGKEAAKRAYNEYLNATNQYLQCPPDQFERQMEMAGRMNSIIQSMVQGVAIGNEALEDINKRVRTGDQSALMEQGTVEDTLSKMLKTIWVHNTSAKGGKNAGLETKYLESQLTGRLNRISSLNTTDEGIALQSNDDADVIWAESLPSTTGSEVQLDENGNPVQDQNVQLDENGNPIQDEEVPLDENGNPIQSEDIPLDENGNPVQSEDVPLDENGNPVQGKETLVDENGNEIDLSTLSDQELEELLSQIDSGEVDENGNPIQDQNAQLDENGNPVQNEEVSLDENGNPTQDQNIPLDENGNLIQNEDVPLDENGEPIQDEEVQLDENGNPISNKDEIPSNGEVDEDSVYCPVCDKYVTEDEILDCQNEECPFLEDKNNLANANENSTPVSEGENKDIENEKDKKKTEKHFIILDHDDHSNCEIKSFRARDYTGVKGEYCVTCKKTINYSFDQETWSSNDAKLWISKQFKKEHIEKKSAEEIVRETLDKIPEDVIQKWIEKQTPIVEKSMNFDFSEEDAVDLISKGIENAFSSINKHLKDLGV